MEQFNTTKTLYLAALFIVLFTFFFPINPIIKSIFLLAYFILICFTSSYSTYLPFTTLTLPGIFALSFFFYILITCGWSEAPLSLQLEVIRRHVKLLYFPVLALGFINPKLRTLCLNSYLAAIVFTCIISFFKAKGIFLEGDPGEVFYNRIITGFMVAFSSYLSGLFFFRSKGALKLVYSLITLITSYQVLFINTGRTGYIVYFILMALLVLQQFSLKKAVLALIVLCAMMALVYEKSTTMQMRIQHLASDIHFLQQHNENTSLGYRIQFHNYAKSLWSSRPLTGIGTGGFEHHFFRDTPIPSWGKELSNPHSQYWMTLSEHGLIGLTLFVLFLCSLLMTSLKLQETKPILLGILIAFSIGSFSDTIFSFSTAGFLLILISSLSYGELLQNHIYTTMPKNETIATELSSQNLHLPRIFYT